MKRLSILALLFFVAIHASSSWAATRYTLTGLGSFGTTPSGITIKSYAYGVNDLGHVAGYGTDIYGRTQGFIWKDGVMTGLGTLLGMPTGTIKSYAYGISDADVVVGESTMLNGSSQAFKWQGGTMTGLGYLSSGTWGVSSLAYGISDLNPQLIVGQSSSQGSTQAFIYGAGMGPLNGLSSPSVANAVNSGGVVVGNAMNGYTQAYVWNTSGTVTWLGALGPGYSGIMTSAAYGINDAMEVVGTSSVAANHAPAAFIWTAAQGMRSLGDLATGYNSFYAYDISNNHVVVGTMFVSPPGVYQGFIWDAASGIISLDSLVNNATGWTIQEARAINDNGQIVGWARNPFGGTEAVLLTPVPVNPVIACSPASLTFNAAVNGPNPANQTLNISNSGNGTLDWSVSSSAAWLTAAPASGSQSGAVAVTANVAGLAVGTYLGNLTVAGNASNSPVSVAVTLNVTAAPTISVSPTALLFSLPQGSTTSGTQILNVTNSGGGTLSWTVSADQAWIRAFPSTGNPSTYAYVYVDATGKAMGTYNGNLIITASGATNSPKLVPVTLTVTAPPAPIAITYPNGGETLHYNQNVTITWTLNNPQGVTNTETSYSTDAGLTWKLIKAQRGLFSSCPWRVPSLKSASSQCLVKTVLKNKAGAVVAQDASNATFTITK